MKFEQWKKDKTLMYDDIDFWMKILEAYRIGSTINGDFVDSETNCKIRKTHLACILKRNYIEENRTLKGKCLDIAVKTFIESVNKTTNKIIQDKIDCNIPLDSYVDVKDKYL